MLRHLLHTLLILSLLLNGSGGAWAMVSGATLAHEAAASRSTPARTAVAAGLHDHAGHTAHGAARDAAASGSADVDRGASGALAASGHRHLHAATGSATDASSSADDCCNEADCSCSCGCAVPPVILRLNPVLAAPGRASPELSLPRAAVVRGRSNPPFRPPAA